MINFTQFLEEGIWSQQEYAKKARVLGPIDELTDGERYSKVLEHIGHLIEEAIETRMLVPRRSWKKNEIGYLETEELRKEFCYELTDILLFFRAIVAYSGISPKEFEDNFREKLDYNKVRKDHK